MVPVSSPAWQRIQIQLLCEALCWHVYCCRWQPSLHPSCKCLLQPAPVALAYQDSNKRHGPPKGNAWKVRCWHSFSISMNTSFTTFNYWKGWLRQAAPRASFCLHRCFPP